MGFYAEEEPMAYTVKKFSELAKVTVRTLHFYEEVGILPPSYYGANGYRYYEDKELLLLEEILLLKELGFSIGEIKNFFSEKKKKPLNALLKQKQALTKKLEKLKKTLCAVEKTIHHLKGYEMKDELFQGVDIVKQTKENTPYKAAEEIMLSSCISSTASPSEKLQLQSNAEKILKKIATRMLEGLSPQDKDTQKELEKYLAIVRKNHILNEQVCLAFAILYNTHPVWIKQLTRIDKDLPDFLANAMKHFARNHF